LTACGTETHAVSLPSATMKTAAATRQISSRGQRFSAQLAAVRSVPVETNIAREAAKGARVFRVAEVTVIDPATHQAFSVARGEVKRTANGIVVFEGPKQIVLSKGAKVSSTTHYAYLFRHGAELDPDPRFHAERIK
jgi:hypothetical protein